MERCAVFFKHKKNARRWNHLACWRVPSKVWLGLPDADDAARVEAALLSMLDAASQPQYMLVLKSG